MDLSNLSSELPVTRPVSESAVQEVRQELAAEFKNAAKSVASLYASTAARPSSHQKSEFASAARSVAALYRCTNQASALMHHRGYLECLDDLLEVIAAGGDMENWALTKRAEITNKHKSAPDKEKEIAEIQTSEPFEFPHHYEFDVDDELAAPHSFRPGFAPLSVLHTQKQRATWLKARKERDSKRRTKIDDASSEESEHSDSDKRKKLDDHKKDDRKKRKVDTASDSI